RRYSLTRRPGAGCWTNSGRRAACTELFSPNSACRMRTRTTPAHGGRSLRGTLTGRASRPKARKAQPRASRGRGGSLLPAALKGESLNTAHRRQARRMIYMTTKRHEEQMHDEVFVGNIRVGSDLLSHLNGVAYRIGVQAFDLDGNKLPQDYMRPLFVKRRDYAKYDHIMVERLRDAR